MPQSRTRNKAGKPVRFVKSSKSSKRTKSSTKRTATRRAASRPSVVGRRTVSRVSAAEGLPSWSTLSGSDAGSARPKEFGGLFATVSTIRLALMIIACAALLTLYVGHVYATSGLLAEVDQLRRENLELHLEHNQVKAAFDRATSPTTVVSRARSLGLEESVPSGAVLFVEGR